MSNNKNNKNDEVKKPKYKHLEKAFEPKRAEFEAKIAAIIKKGNKNANK